MNETTTWTGIEKSIYRFLIVFIVLFICSFSFPHTFIPDIGKYSSSFFEMMVKWTARHVFRIHHTYTSKLISDSTGFYINAFNILIISLVVAFIGSVLDTKRKNYVPLRYWLSVFISYYLALQLFTYGFSKIFKWQFYLPEPNTLFTSIGATSRDLLYWSTMGTSRMYSIFLGSCEIIGACLLLIRRTRILGALVTMAIMLNVVMINFSFDISVKLYSCFLLILAIVVAAPALNRVALFFVSRQNVSIRQWSPELTPRKRRIFLAVKIFIIIVIVIDSLSGYFRTRNFNDDTFARTSLHGAYEVKTFVKNGDTLAPLLTDTYRWRRMFVHRRGYLVVQQMNDSMQSYSLEVDSARHTLVIDKDADSVRSLLHYQWQADSGLFVSGMLYYDTVNMVLRKINLTALPALEKRFHWTIDE